MEIVKEYFSLKPPRPYLTPTQPRRGELRQMSLKRDLTGMSVILRKYPQAVNQVAPFSISPLHEACRLGDRAMVEYLLMKGADPHSRDRWKRTPLWIASWWCRNEIVDLLLQAGAGCDILVEDWKGRTPLAVAGTANHSDGERKDKLIKVLTDLEMVGEAMPLLAPFPPPHHPLEEQGGGEEGQEEEEEDPVGGPLTLVGAVRATDPELVEQVLRSTRPCPVNDRDSKTGWTALMWALTKRSLPICRRLVSAGADCNLTDPGGLSAVHWAAYHGPVEACALMLAHGGDLTKRTVKGGTPLHMAAKAGREDVMRCLLANGAIATMDARDAADRTALCFAVNGGHVGAVDLLLSSGADFVLPDKAPKDPSGGLCLKLIEVRERAYLLHKLRVICKREMDRKTKREGLVPRVLQCGKSTSPRQCLLRLAVPSAENEDNHIPTVVLAYVVKDICSELFIELLASM